MTHQWLYQQAADGAQPVARHAEPAVQPAIEAPGTVFTHHPDTRAGNRRQRDGFLARPSRVSYGFCSISGDFNQPVQDQAIMSAVQNDSTSQRGIAPERTHADDFTIAYGGRHRLSAGPEAYFLAAVEQGQNHFSGIVHGG